MDKDFIIGALNTAKFTLFADAEANAAGDRINRVVAKLIQDGDAAKPLSLIQTINVTQDTVIFAEAMILLLQDNQDMRDHIASLYGEEMVWKSIAHWKTQHAVAVVELGKLKQQLAA